jgi:hypothetical protein
MIEYQKVTKYINTDDISIINDALNNGYDISIKRMDNGVKIIQEKAKVLRKTVFKNNEQRRN